MVVSSCNINRVQHSRHCTFYQSLSSVTFRSLGVWCTVFVRYQFDFDLLCTCIGSTIKVVEWNVDDTIKRLGDINRYISCASGVKRSNELLYLHLKVMGPAYNYIAGQRTGFTMALRSAWQCTTTAETHMTSMPTDAENPPLLNAPTLQRTQEYPPVHIVHELLQWLCLAWHPRTSICWKLAELCKITNMIVGPCRKPISDWLCYGDARFQHVTLIILLQ